MSESDRFLDATTANLIMGWENVAPHVWLAPGGDLYTTDVGAFSLDDIPEKIRPPGYSCIQAFYPSSDGNDALWVVESLRTRYPYFAVSRVYPYPEGGYRARFENVISGFNADADTIPRAICLAALGAWQLE